MSDRGDKTVTVHVKYGDLEKTFVGDLEEVWLSVNRFFSEFLPAFEISKKLRLNVDLQALVKDCEGLIAFSTEGANLLVPKERLTDNETLLLWLLAYHIGFQLGLVASDAVSKEDLQVKLCKSAKITSTRLGELVKTQMVAKTAEDKYKITVFGIVQMYKELLPRIRAKAT
ncbi:hypothetical protein C0195_00030 [Candidatus Bathyarchaeota archaeon]|nr:MAG: hypothetical protein C0195_00030 [Candidatus Bathyarchaeota archaeon]